MGFDTRAGAATDRRDEAEHTLRQARKALDEARVDEGRALVNRVHHLAVMASGDAHVTAEAKRLEAEMASAKIRGWRRVAICSQVAEVTARENGSWTHDLAERRAWVVEAMRTRDEAYANE
jgi:hypothetical protein